MTSIMNPSVPFEMSFPHGNLHPGACVMIHGTTHHGSNRFDVNFVKMQTEEHVLHFDFRFDQRETVRNTNFPSWGPEEKSPLPIHHGGSFTMEIRVLQDRYLIAIDGRHHCEYYHRVPCYEANALKIDGDVSIQMVQITNQ